MTRIQDMPVSGEAALRAVDATHSLRITNPVYVCPKHGDVESVIHVFADWPEQGRYCQRCWAEWVAANIPKVEDK